MADNPFDSDEGEEVQINVDNGSEFSDPSQLPPELRSRFDELQQKERELDRREALFDEREQILWDREKSVMDKRPKNWPPCKPIVRHNIEEDIPESWQRLMKFHYIEFMVFTFLVLFNTVTLLIGLFAGKVIGDFFISLVFIFILLPFHFMVYRGLLYQSLFKKKSSVMYLWFGFRGLEVLSYGYFAFGFPGSGAAGYWNMAELLSDDDSQVAGFMALVCAILFTILFIGSLVAFIMVRRRYAELGGLSKAKDEARKRALQTARDNPDLVAKGAKAGANAARENPDQAAKLARAAV